MKNKKLPLAFNKKNAIDFARHIYSIKQNGKICFTQLCTGELYNNKLLHCAVGEAYVKFISNDGTVPNYIGTENVISELTKIADHLSPYEGDKYLLSDALYRCLNTNDNSSFSDFEGRAKHVAEVWMEKVVPLLK